MKGFDELKRNRVSCRFRRFQSKRRNSRESIQKEKVKERKQVPLSNTERVYEKNNKKRFFV